MIRCYRVIVQCITGREGIIHTKQMIEYGTNIVGGITPGKGGEWAEGKPVYIVWGNNDGDRLMITSNAEAYKSITLCGEYARLELDGTRIFVTHYPGIAESVADSADYDLVCYGHDHTQAKKEISDTILLNPGEIMGLNGTSSLALFNTKSKKCLFIDV